MATRLKALHALAQAGYLVQTLRLATPAEMTKRSSRRTRDLAGQLSRWLVRADYVLGPVARWWMVSV
jgi:hypothetical protein